MKVFLVGAMTVCGRISPAVMGSDRDRNHLEELRRKTGASLMGASTLRSEDPEMRIAGELPETRYRSIITRSGILPSVDKNILSSGPRPIIFTSHDNKPGVQDRLAGRAEVIALPEGPCGLSIKAAEHYFEEKGVESLLIEGGGKLNYAALHEGIVDELFLTITPTLSGDSAAAVLVHGPESLGNPFMNLDMLSCRTADTGELFVHYRVRRS